MEFRFIDGKVEELYDAGERAKGYPPDVLSNFFEVIDLIASAVDERDFYAAKALHFEKLEGKLGKEGKRSMRLTKQWRLIVSLENTAAGKHLIIWKIDKHTYR